MLKLYEGMFYTDNASAFGAGFFDFFYHLFFRILGARFAIGGHDKVENKVDIRFPFRHAEIVYGKRFVHFFCLAFRKRAQFVDKGIVHN